MFAAGWQAVITIEQGTVGIVGPAAVADAVQTHPLGRASTGRVTTVPKAALPKRDWQAAVNPQRVPVWAQGARQVWSFAAGEDRSPGWRWWFGALAFAFRR